MCACVRACVCIISCSSCLRTFLLAQIVNHQMGRRPIQFPPSPCLAKTAISSCHRDWSIITYCTMSFLLLHTQKTPQKTNNDGFLQMSNSRHQYATSHVDMWDTCKHDDIVVWQSHFWTKLAIALLAHMKGCCCFLPWKLGSLSASKASWDWGAVSNLDVAV